MSGPWTEFGTAEATGAPPVRVVYAGRAGPLLRIALRGGVLTLLTLGLHRFWYLTRLRRFHWSALRLDGEALEYTGRPGELLLGFLVAAVLLAAVLGAANLGLAWGGIVGGWAPEAAFNAAAPLLVPLWFYAGWQARRYRAARTRWRGIRFGMAPRGGWPYALRGTLWLAAVAATLGLLWPAMQVSLRRRVMDRTYWGDLGFRQGGGWGALMRPWLAVWGAGALGLGASAAVGWRTVAAALEAAGGPTPAPVGDPVALVVVAAATLGAVWLLWQRYDAAVERALIGRLTLGGARFSSDLTAGRLIRVRLLGALALAAVVGGALLAAFGGVAADAAGGLFADRAAALVVAAALAYAAVFVLYGAVREVALVRPLIAAHAGAVTVTGLALLDVARQRPADAAEEAGGFAEALDVDIGL